MQIAVDKNQLSGSHGKSNRKKHEQMEAMGVELVPLPLPFGDYCLVDEAIKETMIARGNKISKKDLMKHISFSIDTKKNIEEIWANVHGSKEHIRFRKELLKPMNEGSKLLILIEHGPDIQCLEDVYFFYQPEQIRYKWVTKKINGKAIKYREPYTQQPIRGDALYRSLCTIRDRYNVRFEFCEKKNTGTKIIELLGEKHE